MTLGVLVLNPPQAEQDRRKSVNCSLNVLPELLYYISSCGSSLLITGSSFFRLWNGNYC